MVARGKLEAQLNGFFPDFREDLIEVAQKAMQKQVDTLNEAVKEWKNQPIFRRKTVHRTGRTEVQLLIEGPEKAVEIFGYVDKGTEPHIIVPVRAAALAFRTGYSARTAPIANAFAGTGKAFGPTVVRKWVLHPGSEAREFIGYAMLEAEEDFQQGVAALVRRIQS